MTHARPVRSGTLLKAIGPGVMYAGAAIGVSHLVQSTRAGAGWGFALLWIVVLVHLFKYPFFEFGQRYTAATGESLLQGYRRLGCWAILSYLVLILILSIPTGAVLTIVTAALASQVFPSNLSVMHWVFIMLACCMLILGTGGYPLLDRVMKIMMVFLALTTFVAVVAAAWHGSRAAPDFAMPPIWDKVGVAFLVAFMGWMPTPVDCSAWPSLWMLERTRQTGHRPTLGETLFDFNLGYFATFAMALAFLSLGALVMYGTGENIAADGAAFAAQFIGMYVHALGGWSRPVIVTAAFITMLSTMLTVYDAYPRVLRECCRQIRGKPGTLHNADQTHAIAQERVENAAERAERHGSSVGRAKPAGSIAVYWAFLSAMMLGAVGIFQLLTSHMRTLVDLVTTLAFLSAPVVAYLNWRVIRLPVVPAGKRPPHWLHALSALGMIFLVCFGVWFIAVHFGGKA